MASLVDDVAFIRTRLAEIEAGKQAVREGKAIDPAAPTMIAHCTGCGQPQWQCACDCGSSWC